MLIWSFIYSRMNSIITVMVNDSKGGLISLLEKTLTKYKKENPNTSVLATKWVKVRGEWIKMDLGV